MSFTCWARSFAIEPVKGPKSDVAPRSRATPLQQGTLRARLELDPNPALLNRCKAVGTAANLSIYDKRPSI